MNILIIGGIAAGASVAAKAKRTNPEANVTIIEKNDYLSFGACGLPYYLGGEFDNADRMYARSIEKTKEQGIEVLSRHEALSIDFDNKKVNIKNLENSEEFERVYDKLAICTGATPVVFGEGSDSENVFTMVKEDDANRLKAKLDEIENIVVIGAGFIGLEVAEQLVSIGKNVTVVHRENDLLTNIFDDEISEMIKEKAIEHGIKFKFGNTYESFKTDGNKAIAVITDKEEIPCDAAVMALGFRPNTSFIDDSRLEKIKNGAIIVDDYGRTSIEDVYSAGDCATVHNKFTNNFYAALATYANKMGRLVGENIVSENQKSYIGALGSSSIKVGEYGATSTGLTEEKAKDLGLNYKATFIKAKNQTSYLKGQEDIFIKLIYDKETRVILGGQIFGKKGIERITALVVAIHKEVTVDELGFMDFPYSPPFSPTWDPLNVAGNASK
nr:CoA-disulfide reductase [Helcococcus sueciensis]